MLRLRNFAGVLVLLGLVAITGCGDGKIRRYPVTGSVIVDGKPAAGAMVIFCPIEGSDKLMRERPFGTTGSDGKFLLTTIDKDDGAPAGDYKVLVQWCEPPKSGADRDRDPGSPDKLRGQYMNLEKTPLTAKIDKGPTDLPPFDLKSKPAR